jgi:DNA-binding transcriptional LysR family regulator
VPTIVRQFRERNAEVEFSLRNILTIDQIQMLEAGSLDIGFLRLPIGGHSELEVVTVHRELPLTVGIEIGLQSGFPMVKSNFPCLQPRESCR